MPLRVVHVASEVAPFAQSGGLADVLGGLPRSLAQDHDIAVGVVVPLYRGVDAKLAAAGVTFEEDVPLAVELGPFKLAAVLRIARVGGVVLGFVDCAPLYDRAGGLYGPTGSSDYSDNHLRFGVLGKIAVEHGARLVGGTPDVLHVHDWQGSPAAIYARVANMPVAIVTTIHNLAYRGIFPKHVMTELGFPWSLFNHKGLEFYDQVSLLKGGMAVADVVTTVSPSYAQEITTPQFGEALDGFLAHDISRLAGIVNGIDVEAWDPATDAALPARFSRDSLAGKAQCRAALAHEFGLALADDEPLIGVVARMTGQKGLDLVADIAGELANVRAKLVVLGSGEADIEARFRWLAGAFPQQVAVRIGFDIGLSRRVYGGSDLFLMPSRFEPCGLGQLYAMRYGSIPIVHAVGGLRDTVNDPETGICFAPASASTLLSAVERGAALVRDRDALLATRRAAMARDSSWAASAAQYVALYRSLR